MARGRQLADDLRVRHLGSGDVEAGGQVDDETVDRAVLQRLYGQPVSGVLTGRGRRLDDVVDRVEARRALLRTELGALEPGNRGDVRVLVAVERDDRLRDVVVPAREVDHLRA